MGIWPIRTQIHCLTLICPSSFWGGVWLQVKIGKPCCLENSRPKFTLFSPHKYAMKWKFRCGNNLGLTVFFLYDFQGEAMRFWRGNNQQTVWSWASGHVKWLLFVVCVLCVNLSRPKIFFKNMYTLKTCLYWRKKGLWGKGYRSEAVPKSKLVKLSLSLSLIV